MNIRVVIAGRGYDTADTFPTQLTLREGDSLDDALGQLAAKGKLAASSLIAVSGVHLGTLAAHAPAVLKDGDELLLIAPVAGG